MPKKTKKELRMAAQKAVSAFVKETVREEVDEVTERVPGKVVRGVKTTWTRRDMDEIYGVCSFTPYHTMPVTVNGQRYQLLSDVEMTVPTIIRDTYLGSLKRQRLGGKGLAESGFGGIVVSTGAGGLPPEEYREV